MLDDITRVFVSNLPGQIEVPEQKALIRALLMVTYADQRIRSEEVELLDAVLAEVEWDDTALATYVAQQRIAIEETLQRGGHADLAEEIAASLQGSPVKRAVYLMCDKLANADDGVNDAEAAVLAALVEAFK